MVSQIRPGFVVINSDGIPTKWHESMPYERQAPLIAAVSCLKRSGWILWFIVDITVVHGDYKSTYSWGAPSCMENHNFNRSTIYKWVIFHSHVSLPEQTVLQFRGTSMGALISWLICMHDHSCILTCISTYLNTYHLSEVQPTTGQSLIRAKQSAFKGSHLCCADVRHILRTVQEGITISDPPPLHDQ